MLVASPMKLYRAFPCRRPGAQCFLLLPLLLLVAACSDLFGPELPASAIPLDPLPAEYVHWWALTQQCAGMSGNFDRVRWLVTPESRIPGSDAAVGRYYSGSNSIVLASGFERHGGVVRHEMLHALLRRDGHPRWAFMENCAGIVSCPGKCESEAGGPIVRNPKAVTVDPTALHVTVDVFPLTISRTTATRGCATVVVSAMNPHGYPIRVRLLSGGRTSQTNQSFSWTLEGVRHGAVSEAQSPMPFAPQEVRRHVFDCAFLGVVPGSANPAPGEHNIRGGLNSVRSEAVPITLVP